jgi:DNA-directed RNA polymerase subunit RPC12/RpoP
MQCSACNTELPADAMFCIECGAAVRKAHTEATVALPRVLDSALRCPTCGSANPAQAIFCVRCGERMDAPRGSQTVVPRTNPLATTSPPPPPPYQPVRPSGWQYSGAIFMIGLGLIFLLKLPVIPAVLILIGVSNLVGALVRGTPFEGLSSAIWMFAIATFFILPRFAVAAIIIAVGLQILFTTAQKRGW